MKLLIPSPHHSFRPGIVLLLCLLGGAGAAQPIVSNLTPARNARAARTTSVSVGFSQAVDARSARALRVFSSQAGGRKAGVATVNGSRVTFDPTMDFKAGETVWATLDTAARTPGRLPLAKPQVWQFTAAASGTGIFSGGTTFLLPNGATELLMGDVDGDDDLDLVATLDDRLSVRLNDGTGVYAGAADIDLPNGAITGALGDVDGDGDLDVVITSGSSSSATGYYQVHLNNGSGTFSSQPSVSTGNTPFNNLCLADMDGDNDLDLVFAVNGSSIRAYLNNGTGSFPTYTGFNQTGLTGAPVAVGDVDSDGDLDIVMTNSANNTVAVQLNNGRATFSAGTSVAVGSNPESVRLADVDSDGDLDVIARNSNNAGGIYSLSVRLNNGLGTFSGGSTLTPSSYFTDFATSDVDGDGDIDLLLPDFLNKKVWVLLNSGTGTFAAGPAISLPSGPVRLALADVDSDGDVDVLASTGGYNAEVYLRRNGGNAPVAFAVTAVSPLPHRVAARTSSVAATFSTPMSGAASSTAALQVFASQMGGRKAGTATASGNTLSLAPARPFRAGELVSATVSKAARSSTGVALAKPYVWQFTAAAAGGTGVFSGGSNLTQPIDDPECMRLADIDGDQDLDIITGFAGRSALATEPVNVRRNNGVGIFGAPTPLLGAAIIAAQFELGDVDNDGDLDFVGGAYNTVTAQQTEVWLNNGTGTFTPGGSVDNNQGGAYSLGDVDGDGDLDLVNAGVRLNDGYGHFYGSGLVDPVHNGYNTRACVLADLDGDGTLDLLTGSDATDETFRYLNDGTGAFPTGVSLNSRMWDDEYLLRDLDADGDVDFLFRGSVNGAAIWFNNGKAGFTAIGYTAIAGQSPFAVGDVDGDGDPDLLTYSQQAGAHILLNNGQGTFSQGSIPTIDNIHQAAFGDLDGDGDLDLVIAFFYYSYNSGHHQAGWNVRFNGSTVSATQAPRPAQAFQVWPSPAPAGTALHVRLATPAAAATLTLRTVLGQQLSTQTFSGAATTLTTAELPGGVYLLTVQVGNDHPITQRLVIE